MDEEEVEGSGSTQGIKSPKDIDLLDLRRPLKVNALVYKTAEMLGIVDLKELASIRFMRDAEIAFEMDGFEEPARLLYENTSVDDRDLRFKVTQLCVENYDLLEIRSKTLAILQEHEPNVWHVTAELLKRWEEDTSGESRLNVVFRRRLEKLVKNCNDGMRGRECVHSTTLRPIELKLAADSSLEIPCPWCRSSLRETQRHSTWL